MCVCMIWLMNDCYDLYVNNLSCYAWEECDTWTYMIQWKWTMCDIWIYMNANVDYVIRWKICGHYDFEKMMNDTYSVNLMSYITVYEYVPDDYRQYKNMFRNGYVSYVWVALHETLKAVNCLS